QVAANAVALGPGRVLYTDDATAAAAPVGQFGLWSRTLDASAFSVGSASLVAKVASGFSLATSGRRVLTQTGSASQLTLLGDGATRALPGAGYYEYRYPNQARPSGHRIPFSHTSAFELYDERTGLATTLAGSTTWVRAALSGRYVVAITNTA